MSAAQMLKRASTASGASLRSAVRRSFHETDRRPAIVMPALSPFMEEGTVTKWMKQEGESFEEGDVLLQIESEIDCLDVQATHPGIIGKILTPDGSTHVPVSKVIALVATSKEELDRIKLSLPPTSPLIDAFTSADGLSQSRSESSQARQVKLPHALHTALHRNLRTSSFMPPSPTTLSGSSPIAATATGLHTVAGQTPSPSSPSYRQTFKAHVRSQTFDSSEYARAGLDMRKQIMENIRKQKDRFNEIL